MVKVEVEHEPWLEPCWKLGHSVQCEPDEPAAGYELTRYITRVQVTPDSVTVNKLN